MSLSYASDDSVQGFGVTVDDVAMSSGEGSTSFETDRAPLDGWTVPGAPAGSPGNTNDWVTSGRKDLPVPGEIAQAAFDRQPEILDFLAGNFGRYPFSAAGGIVDDHDGLGFALENYDAIGKWRTMDGGFPVDSSGVLSGKKKFSTPAEMRQILSQRRPEFCRTLTEKLLIYALGRGLERFDKPTVRDITTRVAASGYGFQTLVREVVRSLPFQSRRGEAVPTVVATK